MRYLHKISGMFYVHFLSLVLVPVCLLIPGLGCSATYAVESSANLPLIADFTVSPQNIDSGASATLGWDIKNALSITIDHGIGNVSTTGEAIVSPAYTTTYKITAINSTGSRERYVTLSVNVSGKATDDMVGCDPVSGRNAQVDLSWEEPCVATGYEIQIAKDPEFTERVNPALNSNARIGSVTGSIYIGTDAFNVNNPGAWIAPGVLEAGHTYYWRARVVQSATGQYAEGPWSDPRPFTVQPGYSVQAGYFGIQAFSPANGCTACPVKPVSFSWSGYPGTTKYRLILARDSQLQDVVVEAFTPTTSYALNGTLDYDRGYWWQVMAVEPVPSDPSPVFTFHTESAPKPPVAPASPVPGGEIPVWAWAVIIIGGILVIVIIVFVVRAGRKKY